MISCKYTDVRKIHGMEGTLECYRYTHSRDLQNETPGGMLVAISECDIKETPRCVLTQAVRGPLEIFPKK